MTEDLKNVSQDTTEPVETVETQGTVVLDKEDTTKVETEPQEEMVSKKELERILKEKDQVEKRKNQLEKQLKEAAEANDPSKYESIIAQLEAEKEELAAKQKREEEESLVKSYENKVNELFEHSLEGYSEEVKEAARFMRDKFGITSIVGNAEYTFQAESNIKEVLDGLSTKIAKQPEIVVDATNPGLGTPVGEKQLIEAELEKPVQERDFTKIIGLRLGNRIK